jgi:hypothetical protein
MRALSAALLPNKPGPQGAATLVSSRREASCQSFGLDALGPTAYHERAMMEILQVSNNAWRRALMC